MDAVTKQCKQCHKDFVIESEDFSFYERIDVPVPKFCSECRMTRKYLWRNERVLYRRTCDKTGKSIVSMYAPESRFTVYDIKEWWSDSWNPLDYGMEFDFSRPFFEQFKELQSKVPRLALLNKNCENSDFSNHSINSKDIYMCVTSVESENVMHSTNIVPAKNSSDLYRTEGASNENLFECINVRDCYNCQYCFLIENCLDCYYSYDLRNCSNCFLSYNLRGQSYYFMNQKYSREEYFEKVQEFNLKSHADRQKLYTAWLEVIFEKALHRGMLIESSINATGNFVIGCKDSTDCFDVESLENCKNIHLSTHGVKDSYDSYHIGVTSELLYENHAVTRSSGGRFVHLSYDNTNLTYCDSCHNSNELFGCVGIKKGSYMIFNKQYSKEEYFELKAKIIEHMKSTGEWGDFFPPELSPFAYNESNAQTYFPLTKEKALENGFTWKDDMPGTYGRETIAWVDVPDTIDDATEALIGQVFACERTGRNYNLTRQEFDFLKQHNIPIPRLHPDERYRDRMSLRPKRTLYDTVCSVSGVPLKTAYPPEKRPKNIVSDEVYKYRVL